MFTACCVQPEANADVEVRLPSPVHPPFKIPAPKAAPAAIHPKVVEYHPVTVNVVSARGLRNADWCGGKSDPFCTFGVQGKTMLKTKVINDCLEPVWNHEDVVEDRVEGDAITFQVWDHDPGKPDDCLGKVTLQPTMFDKEGFTGEVKLEHAGSGAAAQIAYIRIKVRLPGKSPVPEAAPEFQVQLENVAGTLGLVLDTHDRTLARVCGIVPGSTVAKHNLQAPAGSQVREGDFLVGVDTVTRNTLEMEKVMQTVGKHTLHFVRPFVFSVPLAKQNGSMGMSLVYATQGTALFVKEAGVKAGSAFDWNKANPDKAIRTADWIVSVNGVRGSAESLFEKLKANDKVQFAVSRPAFTSHEQSHWIFW